MLSELDPYISHVNFQSLVQHFMIVYYVSKGSGPQLLRNSWFPEIISQKILLSTKFIAEANSSTNFTKVTSLNYVRRESLYVYM